MMYDDLDIPDFLDRKKNPVEPATIEDRRAFCPEPMRQEEERNANAEAVKEEKKQKARARIETMKAKFHQGDWRKIPEEFLGWDNGQGRFYDARIRLYQRLADAFKRHGLKTPPPDFYPRIQPYPWDQKAWAKKWADEKRMKKDAA